MGLDAERARRTARSLDGLAVLDDGTIVGTGSFDIADGPKGTLIWVRDAGAAA